mgnify:CR=1 FL=1
MLLVTVDFKMLALACCKVGYRLVGKVNLDLCPMVIGYAFEQFLQKAFRNNDRKHKVIQLVVLMNISKKTTNNYTKSIACNGPGRMFT